MSDDGAPAGPDVAQRVAAVRRRIAAAAAEAGRDAADVLLVGVTKTHPPASVRALLAAGVADVGENRSDELVAKRAALLDDQPAQRLLVQVNVGDDPAKGGCSLTEVDELVTYARARSSLDVEGLMTVPPLPSPDTDPVAAARPHFARLREVAERLDLPHLSMGMSADLEAAVAEGATIVRVGTALLGPRGDGPWQPVPPAAPAV